MADRKLRNPGGRRKCEDAKKQPTKVFWSSRVREQLGGGLAASQGEASTVAEGASLVVLVQSPPVAVSWGAGKIHGK